MSNCVYCSKTILNKGSLASHQKVCLSNPNRVDRIRSPKAGAQKGSTPWNKGLSKETDVRLLDQSIKASEMYNTGMLPVNIVKHSDETKELLSKLAKDRNFGGYVKGSGRGKSGWYMGIFCDSSWELAYVIYCKDHNIQIERNKEFRHYIFNEVQKRYLPDFIVDGELVEIKGYVSEEWKAKLEHNPDIKVLYEDDLKPIFYYVINKYGKDFHTMYENNG